MRNRIITAALMLVGTLTLTACESESTTTVALGQLNYDRVELRVESSEPVVSLDVREGDVVNAGATLLQQDAQRAKHRLAEADARVAEASARLQELTRGPRHEQIRAARAALQAADDELTFRSAEFNRSKDVASRGLASDDALDRAQANLDSARANRELNAARLQELLAGTTVEELAQADAVLQRATESRSLAHIDLQRHTLVAPIDGTIDARMVDVGERPAAGSVVLTMLPDAQPYARVYIPETLRVRVKPGTSARLLIDGLDDELTATVRWVAAEASFTPYFALSERDRGRLSYLAHLDIDEQHNRLPDGLAVEAHFGANDD